MIQYILLALLGLFLNVLDSASTDIALNRLPEHLRAKEGNPIAVFGFRKNYWLFHILKQLVGVAIVTLYVLGQNKVGLLFIIVLLSLVVINNVESLVERLVRKKKTMSMLFRLSKFCHIPKKVAGYFIMVVLAVESIVITAYLSYWLGWITV